MFLVGLPVAELSKTFQEAVLINRRLDLKYGIRHLWIDSLCILQDSIEEWKEEAPRMADVYGNCWCNIAATTGGGLATRPAGMFSIREPKIVEPIRISLPASNNDEYICYDEERWSDFIRQSPLNRRAWVCQERLLSPRILHFGVDEIYWECSEGRASETFPSGEPMMVFDNHSGNETLVRGQANVVTLDDARDAWLETVDTFTRGDLTRGTDKLYAIAGVAKIFQDKFRGSEYLAGIWRSDLERQLLWKVPSNGTATRSEEYRAPSWSWASMNGVILTTWAPRDCHVLVNLVDVRVDLADKDHFGGVVSGVLRLQGRLLKGRTAIDTHYFPGLRLQIDESLDEIAFHPDEYLDPKSDEKELYCLPISCEEVTGDYGDEEHTGDAYLVVKGLVLELTKQAKGQYRRIGTFETDNANEVETIIRGEISGIDKLEYEAVDEIDGSDQFTVQIL
jgi:hypothetical protein